MCSNKIRNDTINPMAVPTTYAFIRSIDHPSIAIRIRPIKHITHSQIFIIPWEVLI
jgi:hypothetical protein